MRFFATLRMTNCLSLCKLPVILRSEATKNLSSEATKNLSSEATKNLPSEATKNLPGHA